MNDYIKIDISPAIIPATPLKDDSIHDGPVSTEAIPAGPITSARNDFCDNYCKYPDTWDAEKESVELCESEICQNCPLNKL